MLVVYLAAIKRKNFIVFKRRGNIREIFVNGVQYQAGLIDHNQDLLLANLGKGNNFRRLKWVGQYKFTYISITAIKTHQAVLGREPENTTGVFQNLFEITVS